MTGHILLEGGAEFGGRMADPDRCAIRLAGGRDVPLAIIPAAAAPDHNDQHAGQNGVRWFRRLGVRQPVSLPLVDRDSAMQPSIAAALRSSRFIYLLGGFPDYLGQTLAGSLCWQAILEAYQAGAVVGGSSAGAMVLCQYYYDPQAGRVVNGLGLLPGACVIPHHNSFGIRWTAQLVGAMPGGAVLIGIDEETGLIDEGPQGQWTVYGKGAVTLYLDGKSQKFNQGDNFHLLLTHL